MPRHGTSRLPCWWRWLALPVRLALEWGDLEAGEQEEEEEEEEEEQQQHHQVEFWD
jgi:hypothetical protein